MPAEAAAQGDRAASMAPTMHPTAPWRVQEVTALPDDRLLVRFVDGLTGIVDLSALIASPKAGVFARLRDRTVFEQVRVEMGAVVWPGELDLARTRCTRPSRNMGSGESPRRKPRHKRTLVAYAVRRKFRPPRPSFPRTRGNPGGSRNSE